MTSAGREDVNKILVVGSEKIGKKFLTSHILLPQVIAKLNVAEEQQSKAVQPNEIFAKYCEFKQHNKYKRISSCEHLYVIKTKYYSAEIAFSTLTLKASDNFEDEMNEDLFVNYGDFNAIVLVCSLTDKQSFELVQKFAQHTLERAKISFETALCVAHTTPASAASSSSSSVASTIISETEVNEWCIDNGYELVKISDEEYQENYKTAWKKAAEAHVPAKLLDDEKFGIERIREALECTMWPYMRNFAKPSAKKTSAEASASSTATTTPKIVETTPVAPVTLLPQEPSQKPSKQPATTSAPATTSNASTAAASTTASAQKKTTPPNPMEQLLQELAKTESETLSEEDKKIEQFDRLLADMLKLKSEGGQLAHNDRKEKAATLAMQLFSMLQDGDEDEEESEDDDL